MYFDEITKAVWNMNNDELTKLYKIITVRNQQLIEQARFKFSVGDRVSFTARGKTLIGTVQPSKGKRMLKVITDEGGKWNVGPNLLIKITA